jgi:hypothetical protein
MKKFFANKIKIFPAQHRLHYWQVTSIKNQYTILPKPYSQTIYNDIPSYPIKRKNHETTYAVPTPTTEDYEKWLKAFQKNPTLPGEKGIAVTLDSSDHILVSTDITYNLVTQHAHPDFVNYSFTTIGEQIRLLTPDRFLTVPEPTEEWYREQLTMFYAEIRG